MWNSVNPWLQQTTNFATSFLVFDINKVWYFMRIVCQQTILMKYHALFAIFETKQQNLKLSSAANYRWSFKGSGQNVRTVHGGSCTEAGGQKFGLVHIGKKRNPVGVNGKLPRCKSCGSYGHLVAECPDSWKKYGEITREAYTLKYWIKGTRRK